MIEILKDEAKPTREDSYNRNNLDAIDGIIGSNYARNLLSRRIQRILFCISIFVHLFYYISSHVTQTLAPLFMWHAIGGMDFFQIPNGAYAFLHGGSLTGRLPSGIAPYSDGFCDVVNWNVYHPFFTLLVGIPLQFLPPQTAMIAWIGLHLLLMGFLVYFLWKKFKHHKYIYLALSILLLFSYHYYEIWIAQYHFLLNFFTVLFLIESIQQGDTRKAGLWLFCCLLVKPIGLLWIVPLIIYRRYKTVAVGFGLFTLITFVFTVFPFTFGQYYIMNFLSVSMGITQGYNIYAIKWVIPSFPLYALKLASIFLGIGILLLQIIRHADILTIVTLWVGYQLLFYSLVYDYHYTILACVLCLGILFNLFSPKEIGFLPIIFLTLPTPVVLFNLSVRGTPENLLAPMYLYSACWLCCLLTCIVFNVMRECKTTISLA